MDPGRFSDKEKGSIRNVEKADVPEIAALCKRRGLNPLTREMWKVLWENNPALQMMSPSFARGSVALKEGRIVGYAGRIPLRYSLLGRTVRVGTGTNWVFEEGNLPLSLRLLQAASRQPGYDLFLNSTSIEPADRILRRYFDYEGLPHYATSAISFWIANSRGFVNAALKFKGIAPRLAGAVAIAAGPPVGAVSTMWAMRGAVRPSSLGRIDRLTPAQIGGEFDELWGRISKGSQRLLAFRDSETLRWYGDFPKNRDRMTFITLASGGRLRGYIALRRDPETAFGLRRQTIVDISFADGDEQVVPVLLADCIEAVRDSGDHVLEARRLPPELTPTLRRAGAFRRRISAESFVNYRPLDQCLAKALKNTAVWWLSELDGDSLL